MPATHRVNKRDSWSGRGRASALCGALASMVAGVSLAGGAEPSRERVLLDRGLRERTVIVESFGPERVRFVDRDGLSRSLPTEEVLALLEVGGAGSFSGLETRSMRGVDGLLELRTGERLPGELIVDGEPALLGDDAVRWRTWGVGVVEVLLDDIDRMTFRPGAHEAVDVDPFADTVVLVNGDTVRGFVESVGATIGLDTDHGLIALERERVAFVRFADAPSPDRPAHMVALEGGVVLGARAMLPAPPGELRFTIARGAGEGVASEADASPATVSASFASVVAVRMRAGALMPLSSLEPERVEPVGDRVYGEPPSVASSRALGIDDLAFDGPLSSTWVLPAGADAFAATAVLPERWRVWGDCTLIVQVSLQGEPAAELARVRLREGSPVHRIRVDLPEPELERRRLTLRLEPGPRGAIQNRVTLERPVLRIRGE